MKPFAGRTITPAEARLRLDGLVAAAGKIRRSRSTAKSGPCICPAADAPALADIQEGRVPDEWRPLGPATRDEVAFLAPLDTVHTARGRAKALFDFDYLWEVYKPAAQRRWGYTLCRSSTTTARGPDRRQARARRGDARDQGVLAGRRATGPRRRLRRRPGAGLRSLARLVQAARLDAAAVAPASLRRRVEAHLR